MSILSEKNYNLSYPRGVKKFIRHKAVAEDRSVSDAVNDQFAKNVRRHRRYPRDRKDAYRL